MALVLGKEFYRGLHNQICGQSISNSHISGSSPRGKLRIYSGTPPSSVTSGKTSSDTDDGNATDEGATLLATVDLPNDWMSLAAAGGISRGSNLAGTASATGTATWARLSGTHASNTANRLHFMDIPVSESGGGGGVILSSTSLTSSGAFTIKSLGLKLNNVLGTVMLNNDLRDSLLDAFTNNEAASRLGTSCTVNIYSGTPPASANDPATGTLLVTYTLSGSEQFWRSSDPSASVEESAEQYLFIGDFTNVVNASASGIPSYFRIEKSTYVLQGSCGLTASNLAVDVSPTVSGQPVTITECVLVPGA